METIIETRDLTKNYGKTRGIENLNLDIKKGEIFGFLGPNGAGKTTAIRTILHLIKPTSGKVFVFGKDVQKKYVDILADIGYLPGDLNLYEKMSGKDLLNFSFSFYGLCDVNGFQEELIERLKCDIEMPVKKLSKGNKQKIGILLALFHKPKLLILDEPTIGLDPLIQHEFYRILFDLKKQGTTVFLSSHNLDEVERVCDRIGIIKDGNLVDIETIEEIRTHRRKVVEIHFRGKYVQEDFSKIRDVEIIEAKDDSLRFYAKSSVMGPLLRVLANYSIKDINIAYPDLENVFLKYYEK